MKNEAQVERLHGQLIVSIAERWLGTPAPTRAGGRRRPAPALAAAIGRRARGRLRLRRRLRVLFALAFGVLPTLYALYLAFTKPSGRFAGFDNFMKVVHRTSGSCPPSSMSASSWASGWSSLVVLVMLLALSCTPSDAGWLQPAARFLYYIPGALAGASSVLLWLFVLDPTVEPGVVRCSSLRLRDASSQVVQAGHLPVVFAIIAFWTGAGGWIVVMYGALNNISHEVLEAARSTAPAPCGPPGPSRSRCCASGSRTW